MVLRVKPTPTRLPAKSLYTPMDNTPLHSILSCCHPWGGLLLSHVENGMLTSTPSLLNVWSKSTAVTIPTYLIAYNTTHFPVFVIS